MKHEQIIIERRNNLQKELNDLEELKKLTINDSEEALLEDAIFSVEKQLKLIDWVLNK